MSHSAVVRIFATTQDPDYDSPWQARTPTSSTGSGVVIDDGTILTGAHVVANATFIQVQKVLDPNKYIAEVAAISHDCDLALLKIHSDRFMDGIDVPELGELPELRDHVSVVGFPLGGQEVSITEGVVSRVEVQRYSHSQRHLLAVTVDAAINQGNSGGPVYRDGRVVGIAFQKIASADNVGEMVPPPLIRQFLSCAAKDKVSRVPGLGITIQGLENAELRAHLGLPPDRSGILVLSVEYGNSAWGHLEEGDAVLAIDGIPIANNGTIQYRDKHRTRYDAILGEREVGEHIKLEVLRSENIITVELPLLPLQLLVPRSQYDCTPSYFVYGGIVFQPLTRDFLTTWDGWWDKAPKEFLHLYYSGTRTIEQQEVVVLTQVLADEVNIGYEELYSESVVSVNGKTPIDMADFVKLVDSSQAPVSIATSSGGRIVLDPEKARHSNKEILARYHIPEDRSPDLISA